MAKVLDAESLRAELAALDAERREVGGRVVYRVQGKGGATCVCVCVCAAAACRRARLRRLARTLQQHQPPLSPLTHRPGESAHP